MPYLAVWCSPSSVLGLVCSFLLVLRFWFGLDWVAATSEDDRSSTLVNDKGSREAFLAVTVMNGDG